MIDFYGFLIPIDFINQTIWTIMPFLFFGSFFLLILFATSLSLKSMLNEKLSYIKPPQPPILMSFASAHYEINGNSTLRLNVPFIKIYIYEEFFIVSCFGRARAFSYTDDIHAQSAFLNNIISIHEDNKVLHLYLFNKVAYNFLAENSNSRLSP